MLRLVLLPLIPLIIAALIPRVLDWVKAQFKSSKKDSQDSL